MRQGFNKECDTQLDVELEGRRTLRHMHYGGAVGAAAPMRPTPGVRTGPCMLHASIQLLRTTNTHLQP